MSEFFDEFASSVVREKDELKEKVLEGTPNPLQ
jgi:hypothetical protein